MSNPELGSPRYRPVGMYGDAVVRAAERVIDNERAFSVWWDDEFGVYFRAQSPTRGVRGPLTLIGNFINDEWERRTSGRDAELELPPEFDERLNRHLIILSARELVAHLGEPSPVEVMPEEARIFAFVGQQILDLNQQGALGVRRLAPDQVSLVQHVVDVVSTSLPPQQSAS